ncbi:hypothetical protein NP233_g4574 [Leucocoprinus birnbaumii]|uniref:Tetrapyrrole biosynthesis uroporphyrinogen III synthase domain-containing protein n=1 Tax=Leucocoprinus birnbaumii TaxID=56174 RepID=A0AAD5VX49_9AGAR|nr:hypothetical protein NP233_g4574 [Leucocoprinus birnbaumii]
MPNVILLRAPVESPPDPYESTLRDSSFNPFSLPVLETSLTHLPELQSLISSGPQSKAFTGVIITSKRSCEAWNTATKNLIGSTSHDDDLLAKLNASLASWTSLPFYVVGKGTAAALQEFRGLCSDSNEKLTLDIRGQETGTGEQLAHFILEDITKDRSSNGLLYLTGDKNRDTVPKILSSEKAHDNKIALHALQVYETHGATDFEKNLDSLITQAMPITDSGRSDDIWWIVFFAPSSSLFAYPMLRKHFNFISLDSPINSSTSIPTAKVAAIGQVTSAYLEEKLKIRVDAIAAKPSPEALSAALASVAL